ncbi:MAG: hypothetical protein J6J44_04450 [Lachnospiraceae bacterium]|nr:hypothetical protein [Lachnospiraceae bacterium]
MNKIFPAMYSKPSTSKIIALIPCWVWVFVLFPMFMPFLGFGLWEQYELSVWLEISYHVANGIIALFIISDYLKDDWFMVTTDLRFYIKHIALTVGLVIIAEFVLLGPLTLFGFDIMNMLENLPVVEMSVSHTPLFLIELQPIIGAITLTVFAPISICALFYCFGFAPVCCRKPWLAYPGIAIITLIPPIINILWRGGAELVLSGYLIQLPIHLLLCWSYQKTDNVWTPLISLVVINLLASIDLHFIPL